MQYKKKKIITWSGWNPCQPIANEKVQMKNVRTESKTILVVADISLATLIPEKLKYAILIMLPINK